MDRHVGFATMNNAAGISTHEFPCMCKFISRMHSPKIGVVKQKCVHISKPWPWPPLRQFPGLGHTYNDCVSSQTLILAYLIPERMKKGHDLEADRGGGSNQGTGEGQYAGEAGAEHAWCPVLKTTRKERANHPIDQRVQLGKGFASPAKTHELSSGL